MARRNRQRRRRRAGAQTDLGGRTVCGRRVSVRRSRHGGQRLGVDIQPARCLSGRAFAIAAAGRQPGHSRRLVGRRAEVGHDHLSRLSGASRNQADHRFSLRPRRQLNFKHAPLSPDGARPLVVVTHSPSGERVSDQSQTFKEPAYETSSHAFNRTPFRPRPLAPLAKKMCLVFVVCGMCLCVFAEASAQKRQAVVVLRAPGGSASVAPCDGATELNYQLAGDLKFNNKDEVRMGATSGRRATGRSSRARLTKSRGRRK